MPTLENTTPAKAHRGNELKDSALRKIRQARSLIDSARSDLCNLEGPGYCQHYEKLQKHEDNLAEFEASLRRLALPTGVFSID